MGHALTARYFGWPPEVVLYHMGGYAMFYPSWGHTTRRAVLVLLAGPGAGFLLYFAVWGITALLERQGVDLDFNARVAVRYLEWINLWWGFANLLPVYPLDGGQIARHVLAARWPRNGLQLSLQISMLVAGSVAAYFFAERQQFAALLFAVLCYESFQAYQRFSHRGGYYR
jgi:Zn-dependent protease